MIARPPLPKGHVRVSHFTDAAPLTVQSLRVCTTIEAHNRGGVRLAYRVAATEHPEIIHLGISFKVTGRVHYGYRHWLWWSLYGFIHHRLHSRLYLLEL